MFKMLFILLLGYYLYRSIIKPMLGAAPKEEEPRIKYHQKQEPRKPGNEDDYIDYEEVE